MPDPLYEDIIPPHAPGIDGNPEPETHPEHVPAPPVDPALVADQVPADAPGVPGNGDEAEPDGAQADNA